MRKLVYRFPGRREARGFEMVVNMGTIDPVGIMTDVMVEDDRVVVFLPEDDRIMKLVQDAAQDRGGRMVGS